MRKKFILLGVFLLALFLRTANLGDLPHGFYEEEVTNAYVGRFILQNGKDLYGNMFPLLYFNKFNDYPPVLPMYISGLGTLLFGNTEFASRFPIALFGALTVYPIFGLALLLFGNAGAALFAAFLLAILPWHIVLSRTGAEGVVGLFVYTLAITWVLRKKLAGAMVAFFLTYFLYPSFRILVPLSIFPLIVLVDKKLRKPLVLSSIGFVLFTFMISMTVWGRGRFEQTSIFKNTEIGERVAFINKLMSFGEGTDQVKVARIFHNKYIGYGREITNQYMSYFSPKHLFLEAGGQPRYFNVPQQGLLYVTIALLVLAALIPLGKGKNPLASAYVVYLLLVTPIPAVLTIDFVPHVHRSIAMILPFVLLAAVGYQSLASLVSWKRLGTAVVLIALTGELVYFWHQYAHHGDAHQSILRNGGDKEITRWVISHEKEYDHIIMPLFARLPIYYAYFSGNFDRSLAGQFKNELKIDRIGKVVFFADWCPTKFLSRNDIVPKTLIVENGDCPLSTGYEEVSSILRRDSTRAYHMILLKQ